MGKITDMKAADRCALQLFSGYADIKQVYEASERELATHLREFKAHLEAMTNKAASDLAREKKADQEAISSLKDFPNMGKQALQDLSVAYRKKFDSLEEAKASALQNADQQFANATSVMASRYRRQCLDFLSHQDPHTPLMGNLTVGAFVAALREQEG
jgi:hypothetical protein